MKEILYCGDTAINAQASYLAGAMHHSGLEFDYLSSSSKFEITGKRPRLLILSDYPSRHFSEWQLEQIVKWVHEGMSFWMIGGWDSFYGLNDGAGISLRESTRYPLLVSGTCHQGKTLAFMSDVAPHWAGGLVDWGSKRVAVKAPGARESARPPPDVATNGLTATARALAALPTSLPVSVLWFPALAG